MLKSTRCKTQIWPLGELIAESGVNVIPDPWNLSGQCLRREAVEVVYDPRHPVCRVACLHSRPQRCLSIKPGCRRMGGDL